METADLLNRHGGVCFELSSQRRGEWEFGNDKRRVRLWQVSKIYL